MKNVSYGVASLLVLAGIGVVMGQGPAASPPVNSSAETSAAKPSIAKTLTPLAKPKAEDEIHVEPKVGLSGKLLQGALENSKADVTASNQSIEESRVQIKDQLDALAAKIRRLDPKKISETNLVADEIIAAIDSLDAQARDLLDHAPEIRANLKDYQRGLNESVPAFKQLAELYATLAAESDEKFQKTYRTLAVESKRISVSREKEAKAAGSIEQSVEQQLAEVAKSCAFFKHVKDFVLLTKRVDAVEKDLKQLQEFDHNLKALLVVIENFANSLGKSTPTPTPGPRVEPNT